MIFWEAVRFLAGLVSINVKDQGSNVLILFGARECCVETGTYERRLVVFFHGGVLFNTFSKSGLGLCRVGFGLFHFDEVRQGIF